MADFWYTQLFQEAGLTNDLAYGYNRARLAYNIDPTFYNRTASNIPASLRNNKRNCPITTSGNY
ncbi:hypothetical protein CS542_03610 [Pedobacter sp. IW39]|nr:hypothetical protein CS542_03610 [Pedobacter sp. IW39]